MIWMALLLVVCLAWRGALWLLLRATDRRAAARGWPADLAALNKHYRHQPGEEDATAEILAAGAALEALEELEKESGKGDLDFDTMEDWFERRKALEKRYEAVDFDEAGYERDCQALWAEWETRQAAHEASFEKWKEDAERSLANSMAMMEAMKNNDDALIDSLLAEQEIPTDYLKNDIPEGAPPLPEEWRAAVEEVLAKHRHILPHFERAAAMGAARYPIDFQNWPDSSADLFKAWTPLKTGAHLFQRTAILRAEAGRAQDAVVDVERIFCLARTLELQPTVMSQIARMALLSIGLKGLEYVLNCCMLNATQLDTLDAQLQRAEAHDLYSAAWAGERCLIRPGFDIRQLRLEEFALPEFDLDLEDDLKRDSSKNADIHARTPWPTRLSWRLIYEVPYKIAGLEALDCLLFMQAIEAGLAAAFRRAERAEWLRRGAPITYSSPAMQLPVSRRIMAQPRMLLLFMCALDARIATARAALMIERYRLEHNQLPDALADLTTDVPIDVFSGKTLDYEREDSGYTLRSIGPGKLALSGKQPAICFRVRRPDK